jgi:hypothetical protein
VQGVINKEEERAAIRYIWPVTRQTRETEVCCIEHTKETFWPTMPLRVRPAILADRCDIKRITPGNERTFLGTQSRFHQIGSRLMILRQTEAVQHRFHRWREKSKTSLDSVHIFVAVFTTWKLADAAVRSCRRVHRETREIAVDEN